MFQFIGRLFCLATWLIACDAFVSSSQDWHFAGPNVAFRKDVNQSPGQYKTGIADFAVDGNTSSDVRFCAHTNKSSAGSHAWWSVDLGGYYQITGIRIYNRVGNETVRLKGFYIEGDNGDGKFKEIYKSSPDTEDYNLPIINISLTPSELYHRVRISLPIPPEMNNDVYLTLCEVEIFALGCPALHINQNGILNASVINQTFELYIGEDSIHYNAVGTVIGVTCMDEYLPTQPLFVRCMANGSYDKHPPFCVRNSCNAPQPLAGGSYTDGHQQPLYYPIDSKIYASCNTGYNLNGDLERTCQGNGTWSGLEPSCVIVNCTIPAISNGQFMPTGSSTRYSVPFQTVLQPICDKGFKMLISSIQCQSDGYWNGTGTFCEVKTCNKPVQIDGGNYTYTNGSIVETLSSFPYNLTLLVKCQDGYELDQGPSHITCTSNSIWTHTLACTKTSCLLPVLTNGYYATEEGNNKTASPLFEEFVFPKCINDSYKLEASAESRRRCLANGTFSGTYPICVPLCKVPVVENGAYVNEGPTGGMDSKEGEIIMLGCNQGFELSDGNSSRTCQANHTWTGKPAVCTVTQEAKSDTRTSIGTLAGIGGGSAVVVIAILVVVVALVLYRRRKGLVRSPTAKRKQSIDYSTTNTMMTIDSDPGNEYSYVNDAEVEVKLNEDHVYYTVEPEEEQDSGDYYSFTPERLPESAIRVSELTNFILAKDADLALLTEQFESFPKGMTANHNSATKTENRGKNKYRDMYAYDKTRVVLQPGNLKSETDYINACYINGFSLSKRYIAAQAPFELTLNDFWRMIWQTKVSKIVMLTNLKEEEKVKCEQYWPKKGTEMFGRVEVTLKKTERFSDFIVRTIAISKDDSPNRTVTQFHFTAWPDRGVPKYASSLVHFRQKAMNAKTDTTGPVVVHCSAGVGRTGTFIALDILAEQGKRLGYVDVKGCVQTLRKQRVMMVQNLEQYTFIHMALTEALMLSPSVLPAASFISSYRDALEIDPETRNRRLDSEFEMLGKMSPAAEESQYISAMEIRNRRKNRYPDILPVEEFMPSLKDETGVNYINAVFLPSYRTKNAFIITQTPLEDTQAEFWRLVFDHNVHSIVMMNSIAELQAKEIYWPQGEHPITHDNLKICLIESEVQESHNILTVEVTVSNKKHKLKLFQYCYQASGDEFPGTPESFLTLMELVQYWQQQTSNNPVVVHCMNGVDKSGLYCVISSVIERLKIEQDVAISQTIEVMRNCREQLIPSVDQFQFCHDVVLAYIQQFETYSNFTVNA